MLRGRTGGGREHDGDNRNCLTKTMFDFEHIIANCSFVLKPGGWLLFEIGEDMRKSIENLLTVHGSFVNIEFVKDYVGRDRIICAQFKILSKRPSFKTFK